MSPIPARHQQRHMCHAQTDSITLWSAEAAIFTSLPPPPPPNHHKKSYKEQIKMKYDIALRQTVTSQRQFGGQHGVLHDTGGSKKDALF